MTTSTTLNCETEDAWEQVDHVKRIASGGRVPGHVTSQRAPWVGWTLNRPSQHGEWVAKKKTARSKGSAAVMFAAALRYGLTTPCGGAVERVVSSQGGSATQEIWQLLSVVSQWRPFIIGGDVQVKPQQLEHSGWVRAVGGFVVAPQFNHAVASRGDLAGACQATSQTLPSSQRCCSCFSPSTEKRVVHRPNPWPLERPSGCMRPRPEVEWKGKAVGPSSSEPRRWSSLAMSCSHQVTQMFLIVAVNSTPHTSLFLLHNVRAE